MSRFAAPLLCSVIFVLIGFAFVPQAGIQNDEALFASGIYEQAGIAHGVKIIGHRIPLMLISYLGAVKSWVYAPIFRLWKPSAASTRVPVILMGGATVWLFWSLLRRIANDRAALIGCVLLASDSLFLITTCFDWGPVVLQHLLLVAALLCLARFHMENQARYLAGGFFLLGLGLWDKALFGWMLSGIAIAALLVFPAEIWKHFSLHNLAASAAAFCLGAAPLIAYNIQFPLKTFRDNAAYTSEDVAGRSRLLRATLNGSALLGYIPRDNDPHAHPRAPQTTIEKSSIWLSEKTGGRRLNFFDWALAAALLLTPWLWFTPARRPLAFSLLALVIAWGQILFAKNAGGSVHHVILLWPLPVLYVAVAFAEASGRLGAFANPLLAIVVAILVGSSLLVTNQYLAQLVRNGPGLEWTDAIYPLSDCLNRVKPGLIYIDDWGMFDNLRLLNRGKLPLREGSSPLSKPQLDSEDTRVVLARIADPGAVFVGHTDDNELFKGVNAKLRSLAEGAGYQRETVAEISDRNGRPTFEVIRFTRAKDN